MGVDEPVFNVFTNCQQRVSVDGIFSKFKPVASDIHQGSVLGPLLILKIK